MKVHAVSLKVKGPLIQVISTKVQVVAFSNGQLDCGIHPAYTGLSALPFFDEIDPASVDLVLVTQ